MKHKNYYNSLQNIWYLFKRGWLYQKSLYIFNGILILFESLYPFIFVLFPKFILDELTGERRIDVLTIILTAFFLFMITFDLIMTFLRAKIEPQFTILRFKYVREHSDVCMKLNFEHTEDPDVLNQVHMSSKALSGNNDGIEGIYRKMFSFISSIITFAGFLSLTLYLNPFILAYLLLSSLLIYYINLKIKKFEHDNEEKLAKTDRKTTYVSDLLNDVRYGKEIRLYGIRRWIIDKYSALIKERIMNKNLLQKKHFFVNLLNIVFLLFREGIIYGYLIIRFLSHNITIGDFSVYFNVANQLTGQIQGVLDSIAYIQTQNIYINDYRKFIESLQNSDSEHEEKIPEMPYTIEFRNVSFQYPNSSQMVLKNFSYKFQYGKRVALVGHNGAGKTTIIKLMTGLYSPTEGEILLNGININKLNRQQYFNLFSVLFQDFKLFAFSIYENIALQGQQNIDLDAVWKYINKVGLANKINALPKKAETSLLKALDYDGIELSGGESQRVALARALYKDGNIFIMDEPTAAMDPLAEDQFYQLLNQMKEPGNTYIFVSHRLASTRFCDTILMLQDGSILEEGSHQELIRKKGAYYELFELQAKSYREEHK